MASKRKVKDSNERIDAILAKQGITDIDEYLDTVGVSNKTPGAFDVYFRGSVAAMLGKFRK